MTLPSLAEVDDLAERIPGGIATADENRAQLLLDDVSALIRAEVETDWVDDNDALVDVPDIVHTVCLSAAKRSWQNPSGYVSETIGAYSYRLADAAAGTGVYLTEEEKRLVRRAENITDVGAQSVQLNRDYDADWVYFDVEGSTRPIPVGRTDGP